jgi:hypothetical protein
MIEGFVEHNEALAYHYAISWMRRSRRLGLGNDYLFGRDGSAAGPGNLALTFKKQ